jgi:6-phosphogluconolactonase (cycloisomerase 2 family)
VNLYVSNDSVSGLVSGFSIAANGTLTPLAGSPYTGSGSSSFNHHPDAIKICGNTLFKPMSGSNNVMAWTINANGTLTAVPGAPFASPASGSQVSAACDKDNKFLYVTNFSSAISRFSIAANGALTSLGSTAAGISATLGLSLNPNTNRLYAAAWTSTLNVYDINSANGDLTAIAGGVVSSGGNNHSISVSPDGKFAATEGTNNVRLWVIGASGTLTPALGSPFADPTGCEVVGLAWSPDSKRLFVGHRGCNPGRVMVYDVVGNALAPVAGAPFNTGGDSAVGLAVDFDGRRLFVSHISGGLVSVLDIASSGALTPVAGSPFTNPAGGMGNWLVLR